jgi:hypothetical protein
MGAKRDPFDDLESLTVQPTEAALKAQEECRRRAREDCPIVGELIPRAEPYAIIPLRLSRLLGEQLSGAQWNVFVHLLYHSVLNKNGPVLATAKNTGCPNQNIRRETLRRLERLGIAKVKRKGNGAAPLVTMTNTVDVGRRKRKQSETCII